MTGIEADRYPCGIDHLTPHRCQMLKATAQGRTLTGRDLQQGQGLEAGCGSMRSIQSRGNARDTHFLALFHMCTGMQHCSLQAQDLGPLQFVDQRRDRFLP